MNVLSWNYDVQFEMAFNQYTSSTNFISGQDMNQLRIARKNDLFIDPISYEDGFCILKLNGSALGYTKDEGRTKVYFNSENIGRSFLNFMNSSIEIFFKYGLDKEYDSTLSFAWEFKSEISPILNAARFSVKATTILVIIGYSFPIFKRKIDRTILQNMRKLRKVYIQDPNAEGVKDGFLAIRDDIEDHNIVLHKSTNQFLIPKEV